MALNPTDQDKRFGATRIEPNVDGTFLSKHPNGDKPVGSGAHQAATATHDGSGSISPGGGGGAVSITSANNGGISFQGGPTVLLFDRFDGTHGDAISATRTADVGQWTNNHSNGTGVARFYRDLSRGWLCQRDTNMVDTTNNSKVGMFKDFTASSEFRFAQRRWVPADKNFPGATSPGTEPGAGSWWKPAWIAGSNGGSISGTGASDNQADLVFDTHVSGNEFNSGNSVEPRAGSAVGGSSLGIFYTGFSFTAPTFTTWYQDGVESSDGATDATAENITIGPDQQKFYQRNDVGTFRVNADTWSTMTKNYAGLNFGGWIPDAAADSGTAPLISDCYLALGANSRACILTANGSTIASSTEMYIIPPDSWSTSTITYTPTSYENLPFVHLILADGTVLENVVTS